MGNDESKTWLFENVLFLNPNAPPFISQEDYDRQQAAAAGSTSSGRANAQFDPYSNFETGGKKGVKRATPAQTKLRTRTFRVMVDINGRRSEFQLKCINDPLAFVLCDRQGHELRSLPAGYLRNIERNKDVVSCRFGTSVNKGNSEKGDNEEQVLLNFTFFSSSDTQLFVDTVKLLYGVFVSEYGVSRTTDTIPQDKRQLGKEKGSVSCSIHGNIPCRCNATKSREANTETVQEPDTGTQSVEFPISITGKLETGSVLRWTDISPAAKAYPAKAVEWRISYVPGKEPEFSLGQGGETEDGTGIEQNIIFDDTLLVTNEMVGKYIQVKVTRRVKDASKKSPVVYSIALKGPVTLNDSEANDALSIITSPSYDISIEFEPTACLRLFPNSIESIEMISSQQPFMSGMLTINREGIYIAALDLTNESPLQIDWNSFYCTRLDSKEGIIGNEEDLYLQLHLKKSKKKQIIIRLAMPSQRDRNNVYHVIYFFKLQKSFKGFDRWAQDLERGNFSVFKQRYAKLWGTTSFYDDIVDTLIIFPLLKQSLHSVPNETYDGSIEPESSYATTAYDESQQSVDKTYIEEDRKSRRRGKNKYQDHPENTRSVQNGKSDYDEE